MHIKVPNWQSNKLFDILLKLLLNDFPKKQTNIPKSYYDVKMLQDLGLEYDSIHFCIKRHFTIVLCDDTKYQSEDFLKSVKLLSS